MPPPEPAVPSATLFEIVAFETTSVPPLLKIAPPPSSAAGPLATFPSKEVPSTVISPTLFQSAPPSRAATLLFIVPPIMVTLAIPVICSPPPFPGAATAGATPVLLLETLKFPDISSEPSINSMAPPARLAVLNPITASVIVTAPAVLNIAPPEPEVPSATLFESMVAFPTSSVPPLL